MHNNNVFIGIYKKALNNFNPDDYSRQGLCALSQIPDVKVAILDDQKTNEFFANLPIEIKTYSNTRLPMPKFLEQITKEQLNTSLKDCDFFYLVGNSNQVSIARKRPNGIAVIVNNDSTKYNNLVKKLEVNKNEKIIPAYSFFSAAIKIVCHYEYNKQVRRA